MHLYRQKRKKIVVPVLSALIFLLLLFFFLGGFQKVSGSSEQQNRIQIEQAIKRAAISCYALESFYPADVSYLEEHYGVRIDHQKYALVYERLGSNIMPYIRVIPRDTEGKTHDD